MYEVQVGGVVVLCDTAKEVMQLVDAIADTPSEKKPKQETGMQAAYNGEALQLDT